MKREIACETCAVTWLRIAKEKDVRSAGEQIDVVEGKARREFRCDGCNEVLVEGQYVFAITVTTPEQRPYTDWVHSMLEVNRCEG